MKYESSISRLMLQQSNDDFHTKLHTFHCHIHGEQAASVWTASGHVRASLKKWWILITMFLLISSKSPGDMLNDS